MKSEKFATQQSERQFYDKRIFFVSHSTSGFAVIFSWGALWPTNLIRFSLSSINGNGEKTTRDYVWLWIQAAIASNL